jgi:hypothetical protein
MVRGRMNGHRSDVKHYTPQNEVYKPVAEHVVASHGLTDLSSCFSLKIIKSLPGEYNYSQLRRWEVAHHRVLRSLKAGDELGLNIR